MGKFIKEKNVILIYRLCSIKFLKTIENRSCPIDERWLDVLAELWYIKYLTKNQTATFMMLLDWFAYKFFMPIQVQYAAQYINQYELIVHPSCTNLKEELENYCWDRDKNTNEYINKPVDSYNHLLDALRYAVEELSRGWKLKSISKSSFGL
jgi:hypothetical protein